MACPHACAFGFSMEGNPSKYFIANFCNGISKENTETRFEFSGTENQKTPIIAKIGNVEFQSNIMENKYSSFYICKLDKKSQKVKVIAADMLLMTPKSLFIEDKQKNDDRPYVEKNLQLVEEFGSTKMKRDARSRKRKLDISTAAASTIESNVERLANITLENPIERIIDESEIIFPVKNSNAKKIEEIFNIDDLLPTLLHDIIDPLIDDFHLYYRDNNNVSDSSFPNFLVKLTNQNLMLSEQPRGRYCLYWYYLYTFYKQMCAFKDWKYGRKNSLIRNIPSTVRNYFKTNFLLYENFSTTMRTKCRAHLLIIALFLSDFELECIDLVADLEIKLPKLKKLLKQLGCVVEDNYKTPQKSLKGDNNPEKDSVFSHQGSSIAKLLFNK